ncbi:NADPH-dependent FMN reductase [Nocardiopsis sp. NPDC101807]|uniref:NADPH-dependent FMN reductase n=1 Tax=Nocardiopsis sp. NPDC101807 TaxID=3364339 RepID=UPI003811A67A
MTTTTVLVGDPRPHSRTATAGLAVARHAAAAAGLRDAPGPDDLLDLSRIRRMLLAPGPPPEVGSALGRVRATDLLIVASPTRRATYTGLLKVFLDLLPSGGLTGVTAVPVLVTASAAHTLAVDVHLRPLLLALGATVPVSGPALLRDAVPADGGAGGAPRLDGVLAPWAERAAPALRAAVRTGSAAV